MRGGRGARGLSISVSRRQWLNTLTISTANSCLSTIRASQAHSPHWRPTADPTTSMGRQDRKDDSQLNNDVLPSAGSIDQIMMHISCLTQNIDVLEQQLKRYERELAIIRKLSQGRLKNNEYPSLMWTPPVPRDEEPHSELERYRRNHVIASPLVDVPQKVKGAASHTLVLAGVQKRNLRRPGRLCQRKQWPK